MEPGKRRKLSLVQNLQFQRSGVRNSVKPLLMDGKYLMWKWNAWTRV